VVLTAKLTLDHGLPADPEEAAKSRVSDAHAEMTAGAVIVTFGAKSVSGAVALIATEGIAGHVAQAVRLPLKH
jgi:hypothetical protein